MQEPIPTWVASNDSTAVGSLCGRKPLNKDLWAHYDYVGDIGVNCPSFGRTVLLLDALSFCTSFGL